MRKKKLEHKKPELDDIFVYDNKFKAYFENELKQIPEYHNTIKSLTDTLQDCKTDGQKEHVQNQIRTYEELIDVLEKNAKFTMYVMETEPLLTKYKRILDKKCTEMFVGKSDATKRQRKKQKIFNTFLQIARKYDDTHILPINQLVNTECEHCHSINIEMEDDRIGHCLDCGAIRENLLNNNIVRDSNRNGINESKSHIIDVIQKFQGQQNTNIKDEVYEKINQILERYNLLNNSDKKSVKYERVTKLDVQMALEECKFINYYDDCQLIYSNLTGKPSPDLSEYYDDIIADHDKIFSVYPECVEEVIKEWDYKYIRKSMMSGHYLLYQILTRRGYKCKKEEFNILKSEGPLFFHDQVYKKICERFGWSMKYLA